MSDYRLQRNQQNRDIRSRKRKGEGKDSFHFRRLSQGNPAYIKFKNRQNWTKVLQNRIVAAFGAVVIGKKHEDGFLEAGDHLFLTCWYLQEYFICAICVFLCVCYSLFLNSFWKPLLFFSHYGFRDFMLLILLGWFHFEIYIYIFMHSLRIFL